MKLVKSLLLGSAAGLLAVASSQAADLPYRKAAPIEYVKICDAHGVGFFYIPGTDTCLKIGGEARFEYTVVNPRSLRDRTGFIYLSGRQQGSTGSFARGRVQLDARNTTAWGTLRAFISVEINHRTGVFVSAFGPNPGNTDTADIDKAFVQWAGFTAGRVQSVFDFYADAWPYEAALRDSDNNANVLAYTATFGGGFSGTISIEDHNDRVTSNGGVGPFGGGPYGASTVYGFASDNGYRIPDIVGQLNLTQAWGMVQLSAAAHEERSRFTTFVPAILPTKDIDTWGFAALAGVQFNLPMLAAGDQLYIQGQYSHGALGYMLNGSRTGTFFGTNTLFNAFTGTQIQDFDGVWTPNVPASIGATTSVSFKQPDAFSAMAAFQHYFTPTIHGVIMGSYIDVRYPNGVASTATTFSDQERITTNWNEYRIGGQLIYSPIKGFDIGVEAMYARLHQNLPTAAPVAFGGPAIATVTGVNEDGFSGTVHVERDF